MIEDLASDILSKIPLPFDTEVVQVSSEFFSDSVFTTFLSGAQFTTWYLITFLTWKTGFSSKISGECAIMEDVRTSLLLPYFHVICEMLFNRSTASCITQYPDYVLLLTEANDTPTYIDMFL